MKKIILLSLLITAGVLGMTQLAYADNAVLGVYPSSTSAIVGNTFNTSIFVNGARNTVCTVKGTVNFNGLTCQGITVASGLMPQTTPTCANPNFTIGLANCTTGVQNMLSVAVKGNNVGQAAISLTISKVIGVGVDVPYMVQSGAYAITAAPAPTPITPAPAKTRLQEPIATEPEPSTDQIAVDNSAPTQETALAQNAGTAALATTGNSNSFYYFLAFVALVAVGYGVYRFAFAKKKK